jgi:hypothetical protein
MWAPGFGMEVWKSMSRSTIAEIRSVLGETEPRYIRRLLGTHATRAELVEAVANLEPGECRREPSSRRVAAVGKIIEEMLGGVAVTAG